MSKTILITGANRGIGYEIARQLGQMGHNIILTARDVTKGENAAENLRQIGIHAQFMPLNVASEKSIDEFATTFQKQFNHLDVLINNAGIFIDRHVGLTDVRWQDFRLTMLTNFEGPLLLVRALLPLLKNASNARIINLSSGLGAMNEMTGGYGSYRISKTALNAMTIILADELKSFGISVNTMCPGWVKTDMGGAGANRELPKGAETAVWLATADDIPNGKFLRDKQIINW